MTEISTRSVSYTHLDVYKRQAFTSDDSAAYTVEFEPSATILEKEGAGYVVASLGEAVSYTHLDVYKRQCMTCPVRGVKISLSLFAIQCPPYSVFKVQCRTKAAKISAYIYHLSFTVCRC